MRYYSLVRRVYFFPYNHMFRGWVRVDPPRPLDRDGAGQVDFKFAGN